MEFWPCRIGGTSHLLLHRADLPGGLALIPRMSNTSARNAANSPHSCKRHTSFNALLDARGGLPVSNCHPAKHMRVVSHAVGCIVRMRADRSSVSPHVDGVRHAV